MCPRELTQFAMLFERARAGRPRVCLEWQVLGLAAGLFARTCRAQTRAQVAALLLQLLARAHKQTDKHSQASPGRRQLEPTKSELRLGRVGIVKLKDDDGNQDDEDDERDCGGIEITLVSV